jgi:hypothetical protein
VRDFVVDEIVGGRGIGDAQQRLGQAHQDDAFLGRQPVFSEERIDPATILAPGPCGMDQTAGKVLGLAALFQARLGQRQQFGEHV